MHTPTPRALQRLAMAAPDQLDPALRNAAWRTIRRRFGLWLRECLAAFVGRVLDLHARTRAASQT